MAIRWALVSGALMCAAAVAGGAFGAHGLADKLTTERLALWHTAAQYLMYAGLGALGSGLLGSAMGMVGPVVTVVTVQRAPGGLALVLGGVIFAGTVGALALGSPRWLGAVTPIGGVLLIVGFCSMAWSSWRHFS